MRRIAVAGVAALVVALAGCNNSSSNNSSSSNNGSSGPSGTASGQASHAPAAHTPTAGTGGSLPSTASLQSALLTATDLGGNPSKVPSGGTSTDTGCSQLDPIISDNYIKHSGQHESDVQYLSGGGATSMIEVLVAESPSQASADYAQISSGTKTCTSIQDISGTVTTDLTLSHISLGSGTAAVRIDGTNAQGTTLTLYLAATLVKPNVLLIAGYGEQNSGSSQTAYTLFQKAVSKAKSHLSG